MAALGLDPFRYLECSDPVERSMIVELTNRLQSYKDTERNNLAIEIANNVGKLFKK